MHKLDAIHTETNPEKSVSVRIKVEDVKIEKKFRIEAGIKKKKRKKRVKTTR
jgi:hypothetical protein